MTKESKMIKTNTWVGVEALEEIEAALEETQCKYSTILNAFVKACQEKNLVVLSQKIAVNQVYKSFWALIEVQGEGNYNPVLGLQMNWGSLNIKSKWGCHFKEEDVYAFPVGEVAGSNQLLNGVTSIIGELDKWVLKIEEAFKYLNRTELSRTDAWGVYMFQIAYVLKILPSSAIYQTMKDWDEEGDDTLHSFYMALCRKVTGKEPNALFAFHERLLKSKYFTPDSPIKNLNSLGTDYEPIETPNVDEASRETEALSRDIVEEEEEEEEEGDEEDEGLVMANKYL